MVLIFGLAQFFSRCYPRLECRRKALPKQDRTKRTITRTFRISKGWDDVLQLEAERQGLSVNVLVNKILRKYAIFDKWSDRYGIMELTTPVFREILETVPEENLALAGEKSGSKVSDLLSVMGLSMDYDSFVYMMEEVLGGQDFARWFHCFRNTQGRDEIFHLQHDLGRGWSAYLGGYLQSYLKALNNNDAEIRIYDYAVTLKIRHPHLREQNGSGQHLS